MLKFKPQHAGARCRVFCGGNSCLGNRVSLRHSESRGADSEDALQCTRGESSLDRDKWNNHTQSKDVFKWSREKKKKKEETEDQMEKQNKKHI